MCTYKSSSGREGESEDVGNGSGSHGWNLFPSGKKMKSQSKMPKRGPGVAELEKILRDQRMAEKKNKANDESFSSLFNSPYSSCCPSQISPTCPLPTAVPVFKMAPHLDHFKPSLLQLNGNENDNRTGRNVVLKIGEFPTVLPEKALLAAKPFPEKTVAPNLPAILMVEGGHLVHPPSLMNPLPDIAIPSFKIPPPAGLNSHVEPPSLQRSYPTITSSQPMQDKMVSAKHRWPCSTENTPDPNYQIEVEPFSNQTSRPPQSSPTPNPREAKDDGDFLTLRFIPLPTAETIRQQYSKSEMLSSQRIVAESDKLPGPSEAAQTNLSYRFLQPKKQTGEDNNDRTSELEESLDLSLKL